MMRDMVMEMGINMEDFEYAWDFGGVSALTSEVEKLRPEVERLTNVSNNETRMRQFYVNQVVELKNEQP